MTVAQALEAVAKIYEPGCVAYYAKQPTDPWQAMLDRTEAVMLGGDPKLVAVIGTYLFEESRRLIEDYRRLGRVKPAVLTPEDAFVLGADPESFVAAQSLTAAECYSCGETKGIQPEGYGDDGMRVRLACPACKTPAGRKVSRTAPRKSYAR